MGGGSETMLQFRRRGYRVGRWVRCSGQHPAPALWLQPGTDHSSVLSWFSRHSPNLKVGSGIGTKRRQSLDRKRASSCVALCFAACHHQCSVSRVFKFAMCLECMKAAIASVVRFRRRAYKQGFKSAVAGVTCSRPPGSSVIHRLRPALSRLEYIAERAAARLTR